MKRTRVARLDDVAADAQANLSAKFSCDYPIARIVALSLVVWSFAHPAQSAPERAVCAVEQAIACAPFEPCQRNLPGAVNLPSLLKIDRPGKVIISRREGGEERVSPIESESGDETSHVLQGVDNGDPWSMRIDLTTGRFSLTSAKSDAGFIAFGLCSSRILD